MFIIAQLIKLVSEQCKQNDFVYLSNNANVYSMIALFIIATTKRRLDG